MHPKIQIPFNKPYATGNELQYISEAISNGHLSGDGPFTKKCQAWLERKICCKKALLTHSCTAALEMAAILSEIQPGDEVILPSYTFVSTANAFVLRGAVLVFVDIRSDTLNIDETKIEAAITHKTKAIIVVHYAGMACEMDSIMKVANKYELLVIEDAAQAIMSEYKGKPLGSIGHFSAISFHETKNLNSGEGGALLINDSLFIERAEIIREKGTNRSNFFRGQVDKYTWLDIGSSYLPNELTAAFLWAQLEKADEITQKRLNIWCQYYKAFSELETLGKVRLPIVPNNCKHNGHLFYLLLPNLEKRTQFIAYMNESKIHAVFHYLPLDNSPAGKKFGRSNGSMEVTYQISGRLVRLPFWIGVEEHLKYIIPQVIKTINSL